MRRRTTHDSKIRLWRLEGSLIALAVSLFLMPGFEPVLRHEGNNYFHVFLNGTEVGTCADEEEALECLRTARRSLPSEGGELVFAEAELELTGEEVYWGRVTGRREMTDAMEDVLRTAAQETLERCYTVKIADFIVSLRSKEEVLAFLQGTLAKYDPDGQFVVNLAPDPTREINVLTASVVSVGEQEARQEIALRDATVTRLLHHGAGRRPGGRGFSEGGARGAARARAQVPGPGAAWPRRRRRWRRFRAPAGPGPRAGTLRPPSSARSWAPGPRPRRLRPPPRPAPR